MIIRKRFILILLLLFSIKISSIGQQSNTMYFMDNVAQSNELNPAKQFRCKFYLAAPIAGPIEGTIENTGFSLNDVVQNVKSDSIGLFLHPEGIGAQEFIDRLPRVSYLTTDASISLANLGFRANDFYITFSIKERMMARYSYPKELIDFTLTGNVNNGDYQDIDFKHFGMDILSFREYALGFSQDINDEWNIGVRTKILFGHFNIRTETNYTLNTAIDKYIIPQDGFNVYSSIPGMQVQYDSTGDFNGFEESEELNNDGENYILDEFLSHKNMGAAIDFGAIYSPTDQLEFSASILDIGSIRWTNNVNNLSSRQEVVFSGYQLSLDSTDNTDPFTDITDSTDIQVSNENYAAGIPAKIYLGGRYILNDNVSFGLLSKNEIYRSRLRPQLTASANLNHNFISMSLSYTIMNRYFNHFGLGLNFKAGPFNMYFISDNIPLQFNMITNEETEFPVPYRFKTFNFRFGLNLMFGCKGQIDRPSIY